MPTKTYPKARFFEEVKKEASLLRKHARKSELNRLNLSALDPVNRCKCVYGQMAGECRSERAIELITKCCHRFIEAGNGIDDLTEYSRDERTTYRNLQKFINGAKSKQPSRVTYLSSIESYILLRNAKLKNLIAYLKGEREDLVL